MQLDIELSAVLQRVLLFEALEPTTLHILFLKRVVLHFGASLGDPTFLIEVALLHMIIAVCGGICIILIR